MTQQERFVVWRCPDCDYWDALNCHTNEHLADCGGGLREVECVPTASMEQREREVREAVRKVEAMLTHLSKAPLDEEWPVVPPTQWLIEGINECLVALSEPQAEHDKLCQGEAAAADREEG